MYGAFVDYSDYIADVIAQELAVKRDTKLRAAQYAFVIGVGSIIVRLIKDANGFYLELQEMNNMSLIEIFWLSCELFSMYGVILSIYKTVITGPVVNQESPRTPRINVIISYPETYLHSNIPEDSIMNPNDYVRGFAHVIDAINRSNQATTRAINRLDDRIDNMENCINKVVKRLDRIENRLDNVENRLTGIEGRMNN